MNKEVKEYAEVKIQEIELNTQEISKFVQNKKPESQAPNNGMNILSGFNSSVANPDSNRVMSMQNNIAKKNLNYDHAEESSIMSSPSRSLNDDNLFDKIMKHNQSSTMHNRKIS